MSRWVDALFHPRRAAVHAMRVLVHALAERMTRARP
jgi:hypothetical protein